MESADRAISTISTISNKDFVWCVQEERVRHFVQSTHLLQGSERTLDQSPLAVLRCLQLLHALRANLRDTVSMELTLCGLLWAARFACSPPS